MIRIPCVKTGQIALLACSVVFAFIPTVFVLLRLVARRISNRRLDSADWLIVAAWLITVALAAVCALEVFYGGFGWHRLDVIAEFGEVVIVQYHIITMPLEIFWTLSISLSKMSLLILYIKVFPPTRLTTVSKITCVGVALLAISGVMCTLLICHPIEGNWNLDIPGRHCGSQKLMFGIYGVFNLLTDLMVLGLPIPSLLGLKLPTLRKVGLVFTFAIGFLTCIASVIRLIFLTTMDYLDITYSGIPFILMTVVEPSLAVSLACVPLLRPLVSRGSSRYSATGTRERVASLSVRGLANASLSTQTASKSGSANQNRRRTRGRSSCVSIPAPVLQYQYEMGLDKDGFPVDIQELMPTNGLTTVSAGSEYHYQAEVTTCGPRGSDESSTSGCLTRAGGPPGSEDGEISPTTEASSNIVVKQEWSVSNEVKEHLDV